MIIGVTDPEGVLQFPREETVPSVKVPMLEVHEHFSVATQEEKAGNSLELWFQITSSDGDVDKAEKVPVATDSDA